MAGGPSADMEWIVGGEFAMGSERFYAEERPVHDVRVDAFWVDRHLVTTGEFGEFVEATGYVTVAERAPDPEQYPDADPDLLKPGSAVFQKASRPVPLSDVRTWWAYVPGANWRHPAGPGSDLRARERHPVVHVAHEDADAYADWAGKSLPTEAEWEYAARGGLDGATYTWGDEPEPGGELMANTWQGEFPWRNYGTKGYGGTTPVGLFPENGFGLYDMAGNVWEWTSDFYTPEHAKLASSPCCAPVNPRVDAPDLRDAQGRPGAHIPRHVIKGGSHLCSPSYCLRYRPAARQGEAADTSTSHIGFRCVKRPSGRA